MQERIEEYRNLAQSPATANYGEVKVKGTPSGEAPFVKWVYKIIELEQKVEELQEELQTLQTQVITAIEQLDNDDYKAILLLRYLQNMEWELIAAKVNASKATVYRWHRAALQKLVVSDTQ